MLWLLLLAAATPTDDILRKAVERFAWAEAQNFERSYVWSLHSIEEELDANGRPTSHDDKRLQVVPLSQRLRSRRLIEHNGHPPTEAELRAQREREQQARSGTGPKRKKADRPEDEVFFNSELVAKFNWQLLGKETIDGRSAFLFSFEPKSKDLPVKHVTDRLFNKLAGKLWIDEQEYQIVRADCHLIEAASMWGGLAGTMRHADFFLEETRLDDGAWLTRKTNIRIDGRVALKNVRTHSIEEYSDFRKITPELIADSIK